MGARQELGACFFVDVVVFVSSVVIVVNVLVAASFSSSSMSLSQFSSSSSSSCFPSTFPNPLDWIGLDCISVGQDKNRDFQKERESKNSATVDSPRKSDDLFHTKNCSVKDGGRSAQSPGLMIELRRSEFFLMEFFCTIPFEHILLSYSSISNLKSKLYHVQIWFTNQFLLCFCIGTCLEFHRVSEK